jgi:multidrug efflux pump
MNISRFFIDRPIFATVLSLLIFIAGMIAIPRLPISEYPEVAPPSVIVRTNYPGANPKVIAETVAAPLEQAINGVENMLYMSSQSTADGVMSITVTFKLGTNIDIAQVQVQNRVSQALPKLPEDVRRLGVTTIKSSPDLTLVVHLDSPQNRYDTTYLRNYAVLQVRDILARLPGMGEVRLLGAGEYSMRVWLDPQRIAGLGMSAGDIVNAIREQNIQVAAGVIGAAPAPKDVEFQLSVNATGRLLTEEDFGNIILKTDANGFITRLRDVARIEMSAAEYTTRSYLNNVPAVALPVSQAPGSNSIQLSNDVRSTMAELSKNFPEGVEYKIIYDPTIFVRQSIRAVIETLLEAVALVVLVVIVFLQTWRASIIPLVAVPVSIIGTFSLMLLFGFSINALSLFGLVLAIGIVVDDAIVVVENVERNIAAGLSPKDATYRAMSEVSGPIVAIALVLVAVFVPIAFVSGLTGQFYRQFALTIAISTVISAINSLTLSPALSALLLKAHGTEPDRLTRWMNGAFGWLFRGFNRVFGRGSAGYGSGVTTVLGHKARALGVYVLLLGLTALLFRAVPAGFIPTQDKQYLIAFAQLPDAATIQRTDDVIHEMTAIALKQPGVEYLVEFPGLSINGLSNSPNAGILFVGLAPFDQRKAAALSGPAISQALQKKFGSIRGAFLGIFPPPPVRGMGNIGGFKMQIEDRGDLGYAELYKATQAFLTQANATPGLAGVFSGYQINVPQLFLDIDREKAKRQGIALGEIFQTLQTYLGSLYVNDFNRFGRTYQVIAQADSPYRAYPSNIGTIKVRNASGQMVPLSSVVTVRDSFGPDRVTRYNGFLSADVTGGAAPGYSSVQVQKLAERVAHETLPTSMRFEWTDLTYQQILAGDTTLLVFPLCVLLVFLVLAALYESWSLPLAVIMIVPMGLLAAILGVWLSRGENNIFTQIGFFVLVGLASKNAILIVEFARALEDHGQTPTQAAIEAARLRLRPILMTSIAFVMGVVPLALATGAGSEMRRAMGVAVFSGMLGVTLFGVFLTPVFYVVIRNEVLRRERLAGVGQATPPPALD